MFNFKRFENDENDNEDMEPIYEEDDFTFDDDDYETTVKSEDAITKAKTAQATSATTTARSSQTSSKKDVESGHFKKDSSSVEFKRHDSIENVAHTWNLESRTGRFRFKLHRVMDHMGVRIFSVVLVLIDVILVVTALATESDDLIYSRITLAIVSYFLIELVLRLIAWGREFFHHRLEIIDMCIIILTFVMTFVFELITINEHVKFGKLLVIFRLLRIVMLFRICTGRKHVERSTRNLISQNKRRYVKDGFDLDLTYITDNIIAMSFPSSGKTSMYRNPISEVARFFNTKHAEHYRIYNLCSERSYDPVHFNGQVERVMIDDHNVPALSQLLQFCKNVDEWMKKDEKNVIAVHCKGGKGRTGSCIASWLIYSGQFKSAEKALEYFGTRRTDRAKGRRYQGVETPSQSRYVGYLERILKEMNGIMPAPIPLILQSIKVTGVRHLGNGDGSDLRMTVHVGGKQVYQLDCGGNLPDGVEIKRDRDMMKLKFDFATSALLVGDCKIRFISNHSRVPKDYDDCSFFFWFHTSFLVNNTLVMSRSEIGNSHKKKYWNIYKDKFGVTMKCTSVPKQTKLNTVQT